MPAVLSSGNEEAISSDDKSIMFNNYFHSVFNNDTSDTNLPEVNVHMNSNLSNIVFSENDVFQVLKKLDINKGSGPNDVPLRVLDQCAAELTPSLTALFNMSMSTCALPDSWKHAFVVPIHKKGDKCKADNYRPISLLNGVSKIMERLVFNHVYPFVYPMINSAQHGFIKNRSATSQMLDMYSSIGKNLDAGVQTDIIFLDFSKAFDSVPHHLLLHKLQAFGFSSTLLNWLNHYLHGRSQSVIIEGKVSPSLHVKSGVPQGSILGPLLFVLYVNDICEVCSSLISLYADDAKIYRRIITINDALILQSDLGALFAWSQLWKLSFNIKKCLQLSICCSLKVSYVYMLDHNVLERVDTINDLGVTVTSNYHGLRI